MTPLVCSHVRLCPSRQVSTITERGFLAEQDATIVTLQGARRAAYGTQVEASGGIMQETVRLTVEVNRPELTHALRRSGFCWWVCEALLSDGSTLMVGDMQFPASISFSGSDSQDSMTLTAIRPAN